MPMYIDLNNPKIIHMGRDKFGNGIYHIPPDLPTADVRENVHAKWVIEKEIVNGVLHSSQFCSNCGYPQYLTTKFCPNCGALMDKGREE